MLNVLLHLDWMISTFSWTGLIYFHGFGLLSDLHFDPTSSWNFYVFGIWYDLHFKWTFFQMVQQLKNHWSIRSILLSFPFKKWVFYISSHTSMPSTIWNNFKNFLETKKNNKIKLWHTVKSLKWFESLKKLKLDAVFKCLASIFRWISLVSLLNFFTLGMFQHWRKLIS